MSQSGAQCPSDDLFRRFLEKQLPASAIADLQAHIDSCADCLALFLELVQEDADARAPIVAEQFPEQIDEYRLLRPLGRGAMGQVFLAHDTLLDRKVAIKLLAVAQPSAAARERFFVEARALARLAHPNVVRIYRVGENAQGPYLVSELVSGRSLDQLSLPLPVERVLHVGLGICRGLGAAHARGALHRDIKPANVMLADDGDVKLLDFGLAKLLDAPWPWHLDDSADPQSTDKSLTRTGAILGTPHYMAPELWRRQTATERSDIYALGALLYELCAGRPPHQARNLRELVRAVQKKAAPPLREVARGVSRSLSDLVERCLRKDPQERLSLDELRESLERLRGKDRERGASGFADRKLAAIRSGHRALCFVRSAEIDAVLGLLQREALVVIAGDAGVGKTRFCQDAILPAVAAGALRDQRTWSTLSVTPGRQPLKSLASALAPWLGVAAKELLPRLRSEPAAIARQLGQQKELTWLLLYIDQLEELLTLSDADVAAALGELLEQLARQATGLRAIVAVRGEFLSRLAALPGLGSELTRALFLLRPLSAAAAFTAARRLVPQDPRQLRKLGAAYRKLGHHDAAAAVLERAVELLPQDATARRLLALTHAFCRHFDAAIEQARALTRLEPESARAWRLLGRCCLLARDFAQAQTALEQAVLLQPAHRLAQRWLGEALLGNAQPAAAAPCFEAAAALDLDGIIRSTPSSAASSGRTPR